jgi:DNA polymerase-4
MDAFFASVEQRDDSRLRGKPVIVGGPSRRGVVLAASYEVRPFGVRSAMSMGEALRRAPHAIVVPPRRSAYEQASARSFAIFRRFTPLVEPLSLDEAFVDVTSSGALFGTGEAIARAIKDAVARELGLTASAGVAPCKFVAKVASDLGKPNGLLVVAPGAVAEFLAPLPVERMWGVGPKTAPRLRALGYHVLADLARADPRALESILGAWGAHIARLSRGEDDRDVEPDGAARSISAEQTYDEDLVGHEAVGRTLLEHARRVGQRLLASSVSATTVVLKVKFANFEIRTRRKALAQPVQDTDAIHEAAMDLLGRLPLEGRRTRLTGVGATDLLPGPPPPTLFPDAKAERRRSIEELTARIGQRFPGEAIVTRASLLRGGR